MRLRLVILAVFLTFAAAKHRSTIDTGLDEEWELFKSHFGWLTTRFSFPEKMDNGNCCFFLGKSYESETVETLKRQIWEGSLEKIQHHNLRHDLGEENFLMAMNKFGDMVCIN